jgi:hypothetical protein
LIALSIGSRVWTARELGTERALALAKLRAALASGDGIVVDLICRVPDDDVDEPAAGGGGGARARYVLLSKRVALLFIGTAAAGRADARPPSRSSGLREGDAHAVAFFGRAEALALALACAELRSSAATEAVALAASRAALARALRDDARVSVAAGERWSAAEAWLSAACVADDAEQAADAPPPAGGGALAELVDGVRLHMTVAAQLAQLAELNLVLTTILRVVSADDGLRALVDRATLARMLRGYRAGVIKALASDACVYLEPAQHLVRESFGLADLSATALSADTLVALETVQHYLDAVQHVASASALTNVPRLAALLCGERDAAGVRAR